MVDTSKRRALKSTLALSGMALGLQSKQALAQGTGCTNEPGNIQNYADVILVAGQTIYNITTGLANAAAANSRVFFPPGRYALNNSAGPATVEEDDVEFILAKGATIRLTSSGTGIVLSGQNISWYGGEIVGAGQVLGNQMSLNKSACLSVVAPPPDTSGDTNVLTESRNVLIDGLTVTGATGCGLTVFECVGVTIANCTINDVEPVGGGGNDRAGIYIARSAYVNAHGNRVRGFAYGIFANNDGVREIDGGDGLGSSTNQRHLTLTANHCYEPRRAGIRSSGYTSSISITDNDLSSPTAPWAFDLHGKGELTALVTSNRARFKGGVVAGDFSSVHIAGNVFELRGGSTTSSGVDITFDATASASVVDNVFHQADNQVRTGAGVRCDVGAPESADCFPNLMISGNSIDGWFFTGVEIDVSASEEAGQLLIQGNTVTLEPASNVTSGLEVIASSNANASGALSVTGNIMEGIDNAGISIQGKLAGVITGNSVKKSGNNPSPPNCSVDSHIVTSHPTDLEVDINLCL